MYSMVLLMLISHFLNHSIHIDMFDWASNKRVQTVHIWLTIPDWWRGMTPSQTWKFFILLIVHSTWILKLAISCVLITSSAGIWLEVPRKGGMFKDTPKGNKSWTMAVCCGVKVWMDHLWCAVGILSKELGFSLFWSYNYEKREIWFYKSSEPGWHDLQGT